MKNITHYTSKKNWMSVLRNGILLPFSRSDLDRTEIRRENLEPTVRRIIRRIPYLVGIPEDGEKGWEESGLMDYLKDHNSMEIKLKVPVLNPKRSFVRDHALCSPKFFKDHYFGKDIFEKINNVDFNFDEYEAFEKALMNYANSTVSLNDYDGSFKAPEVWLAQATPTDRIEVLRMGI